MNNMNPIQYTAAGSYLSGIDEIEISFSDLLNRMDNNQLPDEIGHWEPFENASSEFVAALILQKYEMLTDILDMVKQGIVQKAESGTLDPDLSTLDLEEMAELGLKKRLGEDVL